MQIPLSNWVWPDRFMPLRRLTVAFVIAVVIGLIGATPVHATSTDAVGGDAVTGDYGDVLRELAKLAAENGLQLPPSQDDGIHVSYEEAVPAEARTVIDSVLDEFQSVLVLPANTVQIAVGWKPQSSLGVGGPVIVSRGGRYYPAAVADARFGGQHASGPVDGFVSMGSTQPWHFGASASVPENLYDFRSAFTHEFVHALGFTVETEVDREGLTVLTGRTEQFDRSLYSGGRRLVELDPAEQSAAFADDDVWLDIGGGRLFPLKADGLSARSHFANAISSTDTEPGALMYAGLIKGVRHELDGPVIGTLARLGFATAAPPQAPQDVVSDGAALRWRVDLSASAPPPETIQVVLFRSGAVIGTTDLPGAVERYVLPGGAKPDTAEIRTVAATGSASIARLAIPRPLMRSATTLKELVAADDYRPEYGDVLRLYWAFFNREPDIAGAKYWVGLHQSGISIDRIAGAFASSGEFGGRYGALGNERYMQAIYLNVLGRISDGAGFAYWLGLLSSGRLDRGSVVRWIATSREFVAAHPY
jgi:hypothetical protein